MDQLKIKFFKNLKKIKCIKFLFTGNIGHSQNLIMLLDVIRDLKNEKISGFKFIIVDLEEKKKKLKNYVNENDLSDVVILKDFINLKTWENYKQL